MSHPGYLHGALQMFGPENLVYNISCFNNLALVKIYSTFILRSHKREGDRVTGTPGPSSATPQDRV